MNVRITLDCPTHFLPRLEQSLARANLAIEPVIKNGTQRWQLTHRTSLARPSIPETVIAAAEVM